LKSSTTTVSPRQFLIAHGLWILTFGGVDDNGRIWQNFHGALDDVMLFHRALKASEMAALYKPVKTTRSIPDSAKPFLLWDEDQPLPPSDAPRPSH